MSIASAARIAANKANGLKSTGPRTPEGKARVSVNALKHGLRSERNPLDMATDSALSIEHEEFHTTLAAFKDDLQPHGPIETRLVERLAQIDLRLQRAVRLETTHLENKFHETIADATKAGSPIATDTGRSRDNWLLMFAFLRDPAALKLISQYESRLARDFSRTLNELRKTQKLREQTQLIVMQESREQAQPAARNQEDTGQLAEPAPLCALDQSSHASDGVVAPPAPEIPAEQTQAPLPSDLPRTAPSDPSANTARTNPGQEQINADKKPRAAAA
jgi:TolA-binding protein